MARSKLFKRGFIPLDMRCKLEGHHRIKGLSLIELLMATIILILILSGLLLAFVSCILMNEANNNLVTAANDAQYVIEQIKGLAYGSISSFVNNFDQSQFTNLHNEAVIPNASVGSQIADLSVNVTWTERGRNRQFGLSTRIARTETE